MSLATTKLSLILFGLSLLLKFQAWRHPAFRARLKESNLIAQIMARDEEIGRWFEFQDGKVTSGAGRACQDADVTLLFKNAAHRRRPADAADQLARPDQRAEGFRAHRRRADDDLTNWFAQTVMMSADRRAEVRHADAGRLDALLQHDQRRAGVRLRQGRQDRAHDADRSRRGRRRVVDHRGAAA